MKIDDITKGGESQIDGDIDPEEMRPADPEQPEQAGGDTLNQIVDFLKTSTGKGEIEDYKNHPLNFDGEESTSQILRGLTGFLGDLSLAIIDVGMGLMKKFVLKNKQQEE